jgi:transcriptional regulator with XRE-family HTH domain
MPRKERPYVLPGIDEAQEYLRLTVKEIAAACNANEATVHRWLSAKASPTYVFLWRLTALSELVGAMEKYFPSANEARAWLDRPRPELVGFSDVEVPRDLLLGGRADILTGLLLCLHHHDLS